MEASSGSLNELVTSSRALQLSISFCNSLKDLRIEMAKKPCKVDNKKKYTKNVYFKEDHNDLNERIKNLHPSEIAPLTKTISHQNLDLSNNLQTKEHHLKQTVQKYEELDPEIPCIRKFRNSFLPQPFTLFMESMPANDFRHCDILKAMEQIVPKPFEKKQVSKIQFENMNVICGTVGRKNRWLITALDVQTYNLLLYSGLQMDGEHFPLHCYDDIIIEDDMMHLRRALTKKEMLDTFSDSTD